MKMAKSAKSRVDSSSPRNVGIVFLFPLPLTPFL
jgi:hypothetical protein